MFYSLGIAILFFPFLTLNGFASQKTPQALEAPGSQLAKCLRKSKAFKEAKKPEETGSSSSNNILQRSTLISSLVKQYTPISGESNPKESILKRYRENEENLEKIEAKYSGLNLKGLVVLQNSEITKMVNSDEKSKMEVGAASIPVCATRHTHFIDVNENMLALTKKAIETRYPQLTDVVYEIKDVTNLEGVQPQSIHHIIVKNFPWKPSGQFDTEKINSVITELKRVLAPHGMVILASNFNLKNAKSNGFYSTLSRENILEAYQHHVEIAKKLGFEVFPFASNHWNGLILFD